METARALRQVRSEAAQVAEQKGMPSLPHGGDLLYALRMRRGVSLEEAARRALVTERTLRQWDKATILLAAQRPAEALAIVQERTFVEDFTRERIDVFLIRAEAHLALGNRLEAHDWLQRAQHDVDTHQVEFKRPHVAALAARF